MGLIAGLLIFLLDIYLWIIIISILLSWLIAFDVVNTRNKFVFKACFWINELTRPPIDFLRRYVPPLGGIDITPMILIFGIYIIQGLLRNLI